MWTISAERMKMKKEHRVPLSAPALVVLAKAQVTSRGKDALVFPGGRVGRPLSDVALSKALHLAAGTKDVTVHGLRSTFRDWVSENTDFPRDVAEMALAHAIGDKVEAAYRRGDLLEKRTEMMEAWGIWCTDGSH
jgi:integrase